MWEPTPRLCRTSALPIVIKTSTAREMTDEVGWNRPQRQSQAANSAIRPGRKSGESKLAALPTAQVISQARLTRRQRPMARPSFGPPSSAAALSTFKM